jgi:hypothetical protein
MMNAMPGSDAFSKWFRNLLANAMAFPAAALMLVFAAALTGQNTPAWKINPDIGFSSQQSGVKWIPPLIYGQSAGSTGSSGVQAVVALFGIGILMLTPKVVDMVKEAIQAPEFKYGSAIGEAVGFGYETGVRGGVGAIGRGTSANSVYSYVANQWPTASADEKFRMSQLYPDIVAEIARGRTGPMHRLGYVLKKAQGK